MPGSGGGTALVKRATDRLSMAALQSALMAAAKVDKIVKGVAEGNAWEEISRLALAAAQHMPQFARELYSHING